MTIVCQVLLWLLCQVILWLLCARSYCDYCVSCPIVIIVCQVLLWLLYVRSYCDYCVSGPIVTIPGGTELHVRRGSDVIIKCVISHALQPPPYVFWYHVSIPLRASSCITWVSSIVRLLVSREYPPPYVLRIVSPSVRLLVSREYPPKNIILFLNILYV